MYDMVEVVDERGRDGVAQNSVEMSRIFHGVNLHRKPALGPSPESSEPRRWPRDCSSISSRTF
jgi:hypothetical protein